MTPEPLLARPGRGCVPCLSPVCHLWITIWQRLLYAMDHFLADVEKGEFLSPVGPCPLGVGDIPVPLELVTSVSPWGWGCPIGVGDIAVPLVCVPVPIPRTSSWCHITGLCPLCPMSPLSHVPCRAQGPVLCHRGHIPCPQPFLLVPCPSWGHCLSLVPHTQILESVPPWTLGVSPAHVPKLRQCPQAQAVSPGVAMSPEVSLVPVSPQGTTRRTT